MSLRVQAIRNQPSSGVGRIRRSEDSSAGSAAIWVLACCALVLLVAGVVMIRTAAVLARHRAESAADLAALAAAGQIGVSDRLCAAANRIATLNGAHLRSCVPTVAADGRSGSVVTRVSVRVDLPLLGRRDVTATARAGREPQTRQAPGTHEQSLPWHVVRT